MGLTALIQVFVFVFPLHTFFPPQITIIKYCVVNKRPATIVTVGVPLLCYLVLQTLEKRVYKQAK